MDTVITYWNNLDDVWKGGVALLAAAAVGLTAYGIERLFKAMMGKLKMRKQAKLTKEVCEIIEDRIVCGLSEAINSKRITIDEARIWYGRFAHLGFWGLHPRKFQPKKTALDLAELKEKLKAARSAREASKDSKVSTESVTSKLLDGLEAELA